MVSNIVVQLNWIEEYMVSYLNTFQLTRFILAYITVIITIRLLFLLFFKNGSYYISLLHYYISDLPFRRSRLSLVTQIYTTKELKVADCMHEYSSTILSWELDVPNIQQHSLCKLQRKVLDHDIYRHTGYCLFLRL